MSTHLITGFAGKEHITSADQGSFNAAVMGGGEFVMERGEQFRCQVISNNKVRIYDGDALMQGRHIIIDRNTYEETTHENGTQGYKRIDLIVLTYEKNAVSSVESVKLEVIKGAPAESNPTVPEYITGDILNSGEAKNQMPLYKIPFDGLSIGEPVKLFSTVPTLEIMKEEVDERVAEKIEELDDAFSELEAGIDERFDSAGKPLVSNIEDMKMLKNYGEFSADAKTVGEIATAFQDDCDTIAGNLAAVSKLGAKNLLPYPFHETTKKVNGITFTDNGDGTITANGTATNNATFTMAFRGADYSLPKGNYILTGCPTGGGSSSYRIGINHLVDGSSETIGYDIGSGFKFSNIEDDLIGVFILIASGTVVNNLVFKPMLRHASIKDSTYEPYAMTNQELTHSAKEMDEKFQELYDQMDEELKKYVLKSVLTTTLNDYVLKSVLTTTLNDYVLKSYLTSELDKKQGNTSQHSIVSDLLEEAEKGTKAKLFVRCNQSTLNTPYKAGLTGSLSVSTAMINMTADEFGQVVVFISGSHDIFTNYMSGGIWSGWQKH